MLFFFLKNNTTESIIPLYNEMKVKLQNEIMISLLFGGWNHNFVMLYGGDENCTIESCFC